MFKSVTKIYPHQVEVYVNEEGSSSFQMIVLPILKGTSILSYDPKMRALK